MRPITFRSLAPVGTAAALLLAGAAAWAQGATSGLDKAFFDPQVSPRQNFFRHLKGGWLYSTSILPDRASVDAFEQNHGTLQPPLRGLIEAAAACDSGAEARQLLDRYASFMDEAALETLGSAPLQSELAAIDARHVPFVGKAAALLVVQPSDLQGLSTPLEATPQTARAYHHPSLDEIEFPAAILQPPFFDAQADDAVDFVGIGAVIGHEISHGFDDQGSQCDQRDQRFFHGWAQVGRGKTREGALAEQTKSDPPVPEQSAPTARCATTASSTGPAA